jgi:hypothetical protein
VILAGVKAGWYLRNPTGRSYVGIIGLLVLIILVILILRLL